MQKEKKRKGGRNEEEIVITNQTEGDSSRSLHFSCDRVFVSPVFFSRRILILTERCRFVGHVRNVKLSKCDKKRSSNRNSSGRVGVLRAKGRTRRERGNGGEMAEMNRRVKITKVVKK